MFSVSSGYASLWMRRRYQLHLRSNDLLREEHGAAHYHPQIPLRVPQGQSQDPATSQSHTGLTPSLPTARRPCQCLCKVHCLLTPQSHSTCWGLSQMGGSCLHPRPVSMVCGLEQSDVGAQLIKTFATSLP